MYVNVPLLSVLTVALPLFISNFIVASGIILLLISVSCPVIVFVLFFVPVFSVICVFSGFDSKVVVF